MMRLLVEKKLCEEETLKGYYETNDNNAATKQSGEVRDDFFFLKTDSKHPLSVCRDNIYTKRLAER